MLTQMASRKPLVWSALCLQIAVTANSGYGCLQSIQLWSRYPTIGGKIVAHSVISAALLLVSVIGLWKGQRWGWVLSLTADCIRCVQTLSVALSHPLIAGHSPRFLTFNVWEFAAVAALLYPTVRQNFLNGAFMRDHSRLLQVKTGVRRPLQWIAIVGYFGVSVLGTCAVTAFSLAVYTGQKDGGAGGFLFLLYLGIATGGLASFVFVFVLTATSRLLGSTRLWVWVLLGGLLAPCLMGLVAMVGQKIGTEAPAVMFWGPTVTMKVGWLAPLVGVVSGWLCFTIHPWAFAPSANSR